MRSLKTTCGLTRCKGFSEAQRLLWVLSIPCIPAYAKVNNAMQQPTNVTQSTRENTRKLLMQDYQGMQKHTKNPTLSISKESIHSCDLSI